MPTAGSGIIFECRNVYSMHNSYYIKYNEYFESISKKCVEFFKVLRFVHFELHNKREMALLNTIILDQIMTNDTIIA